MVRYLNILSLTLVTTALVPQVAYCGAMDKPIVFESLQVDLNGDGFQDRIVFICYDPTHGSGYGSHGYSRFVLDINDRHIISPACDLAGVIHIVDIDTTDAYKEIVVPESGLDERQAHYYHFTGDSIVFIGTLPMTYDLKYDGSGEVNTRQRGNILHTWFYPASYRLIGGHRFVFIEKELYTMNCWVTLRSDLTLQVSPADSTIAVALHAGDKGTIVASDDRKWCLFETELGVRGWFAVEGYSKIVGTGKDASDVFDGLHYAN